MKRNKHTNIASNADITIGQQTSGKELIMKTPDGGLVKATGFEMSPAFKALAEKLAKEKGMSEETVKAFVENTIIWTPDMIDEKKVEAVEEKTPKKKTVKRTPKKTEEKETETKPRKTSKSKKVTEEEDKKEKTVKKPRKSKKETQKSKKE